MIKTCFLDHSVGGIVTNYIITNYYLQTTTYKLLYCIEKAPKSHIFDTNMKDFQRIFHDKF